MPFAVRLGTAGWNRQRTDEVLLDVNDVALGHTAVMRRNPKNKWVPSKDLADEALIGDDDFTRV